jgi:hypothetical protein
MEFTNIFWHIRNSFVSQIMISQQFEKLTQETFDILKNQIIVKIIHQNRHNIARFGHLYRKYNMAEHYEIKTGE